MIELAEIIQAPSKRADVVASLRQLADDIENSRYGEVRFACAVIVVKDRLTCFGWGRCTDLEIAGAFARSSVIAGCTLRECEDGDAA